MNYATMIGTLAILLIVLDVFEVKKKSEASRKGLIKVLSIVLFCLFCVRYFSYNSLLDGLTLNFKETKNYNFPTQGALYAVLAYCYEWLSPVAVTLLVCKPFFKIKTLDRLVYFALPFICFINTVALVTVGVSVGAHPLAQALVSAEIGMTTFIVIFYWMDAKREDIPVFDGWKSALLFVMAVVLCIAVALPNYTWTFFFGGSNGVVDLIKDFTIRHRILIYVSAILPIGAYFALRNREEDVINFTLVYFSVIAMFMYSYTITFERLFTNPGAWPLHLCNTAMYLVPLCLVFKTKKLFYFTYFINVFGALVAMVMPNYESPQLLNDSGTIRFWYNHFCAFFMPLLMVALKRFDRPTVKQFKYSIIGFCMYFLLALGMNVIINGIYGEQRVDYFFLAGDHIASTLGTWAEKIYDLTWTLPIAGKEFVIRPLYQSLFFLVYVGLGLAMWFVYELFFTLADAHGALTARRKKIKLDQFALMSALNGRSIEEPMNKDAGIKLELKHFSKKYSTSKAYAVEDANLEVHGGEIFGFLGPNGAGKSTIIKSIVGIQPITEGAIEVCGYDCEKQPVQAKSLIGYVPDHYALYEKLTGREYINYIADIYNVSQEDRTARIEKHIEMFELQGSIDNPIKTYSHGMKQKITIMAALVHDPKLWILDEPLTGLDPNSIHQVKECMKAHAAAGNIVFFSSHIIDVVERICDRITIIKKGKILVTRNVAELEAEGALEDYYLKTINGGDVK